METYRCLVCSDRPVFEGRVRAMMHAREQHASLLVDVHHDELFEVHGVRQYALSDLDGPYICLLCEHEGKPNPMRKTSELMRTHLDSIHDVLKSTIRYGVHYLSEFDLAERRAEQLRQNEAAASRFARKLASVRGVTDFLTECRSA